MNQQMNWKKKTTQNTNTNVDNWTLYLSSPQNTRPCIYRTFVRSHSVYRYIVRTVCDKVRRLGWFRTENNCTRNNPADFPKWDCNDATCTLRNLCHARLLCTHTGSKEMEGNKYKMCTFCQVLGDTCVMIYLFTIYLFSVLKIGHASAYRPKQLNSKVQDYVTWESTQTYETLLSKLITNIMSFKRSLSDLYNFAVLLYSYLPDYLYNIQSVLLYWRQSRQIGNCNFGNTGNRNCPLDNGHIYFQHSSANTDIAHQNHDMWN